MPAPRNEPTPLLVRVGLALLIVYLAVTRLVGIDYILPHYQEPDHFMIPQTEYLWEGGNPKAAPLSFFWYYSLIPQTVALTPEPRPFSNEATAENLEEHLRAAAEPAVRVRLLVAVLSILIAPLTYLVARRLLPAWDSLLAAALSSTAFLHVQMATQARPHAGEASLALLAVLAALRMRARPTSTRYALTGVAAALAVGCLQSGVFVVPPIVAAHLLRSGRSDLDAWRKKLPSGAGRLAWIAVPVAAALAWFGPLFNEDQDDTRHGRPPYGRPVTEIRGYDRETYTDAIGVREGAIELGPQRLELEWFDGSGFRRSLTYLWWNDPVLLVLGAGGALVLLARLVRRWRAVPRPERRPLGLGALDRVLEDERAREVAVLAAYALPFGLVLSSYARTWGRFLLPALPYLALPAAFFVGLAVRRATRRLDSRRARALVAAAVGLLVVALPLYGSLHRFRVQLRPDTLEQAAAWIREHIDPREARILTNQSLMLPLFQREEALQSNLRNGAVQSSRWACYLDLFVDPAPPEVGYDIHMVPQTQKVRRMFRTPKGARQFLRASGADYLVVEVSQRTLRVDDQLGMIRAARGEGELVARFTPREPPEEMPLYRDFQDAPYMVCRNLRQSSLGPMIEIYRLPGRGPSARR